MGPSRRLASEGKPKHLRLFVFCNIRVRVITGDKGCLREEVDKG